MIQVFLRDPNLDKWMTRAVISNSSLGLPSSDCASVFDELQAFYHPFRRLGLLVVAFLSVYLVVSDDPTHHRTGRAHYDISRAVHTMFQFWGRRQQQDWQRQ
jgi:hypothetical protein